MQIALMASGLDFRLPIRGEIAERSVNNARGLIVLHGFAKIIIFDPELDAIRIRDHQGSQSKSHRQ